MNTDKRHRELLESAREGLERAAQVALDRGRKFGTPVWVWEDGEWVDALAEERRNYQRDSQQSAVVRDEPAED